MSEKKCEDCGLYSEYGSCYGKYKHLKEFAGCWISLDYCRKQIGKKGKGNSDR